MTAGVIRTVIVDDDEDVRALLRTRLERTGRFVIAAEGADSAAALDLTRYHQPHVLILDDLMPTGNGIEVIREVVGAAPNTAVVIYTGQKGTAIRDAAAAAGAHAVVGKLDDFELLTGVIDRILGLSAKPEKSTESEEAFAARMSALLQTPERKRGLRAWWAATGTRWWVIALAFLAVPFAAAVAWVAAKLFGFSYN